MDVVIYLYYVKKIKNKIFNVKYLPIYRQYMIVITRH
jgi:hypothetical protein